MKIIYRSKIKPKYVSCVIYARRKAKKYGNYLPYGLFTLQSKKDVINSKHPRKGRVAIMDIGKVGHVGMVYKIRKKKGKELIYIVEANYYFMRKSKRRGTKEEFKILGYYKQRK